MQILEPNLVDHLTTDANIQRMSTFGALSEDYVKHLLVVGTLVRFEAGERVFRAGDPAHCFYIVLDGEVSLYLGEASNEKLLSKHTLGESFGFASMLGLRPRACDAVVEDRCTALQISSELFAELHESNAKEFAILFLNLSRNLSRFLSFVTEQSAAS